MIELADMSRILAEIGPLVSNEDGGRSIKGWCEKNEIDYTSFYKFADSASEAFGDLLTEISKEHGEDTYEEGKEMMIAFTSTLMAMVFVGWELRKQLAPSSA